MQHGARFGVTDDGAHRHLERDVVACGAEHVAAHAVLSALGFEAACVAEIDQRIEVDVGHDIYMAATPAVAAVGAAKFLVFFVPERCAAIAAIACGHVDAGFVNKFHGFIPSGRCLAGILPVTAKTQKAPVRGFL